MLKIKITAIFVIIFFLNFAAQLLDISANKLNWLEIPVILTMLLFCYALTGLIHLVTSEQNMTEYVYTEALKRIDTGCYFMAWTALINTVLGIVFAFVYMQRTESALLWLTYIALNGISALTSAYSVRMLKQLDFVYIEGERKKGKLTHQVTLVDKGTLIRWRVK